MLLSQTLAIDFMFSNNLTCVSQDSKQCLMWRSISRFYQPAAACFPEDTQVVTKHGYKAMKDLQVGEYILGHDADSNRTMYSRVDAWLHRQRLTDFEYLKVKTESTQFYSSWRHNIAIRKGDAYSYVFCNELMNKTLVGVSESDKLRVTGYEEVKKKGVYAPYTNLGNYYIVGEATDQLRKNQKSLILVHSFAEIAKPTWY